MPLPQRLAFRPSYGTTRSAASSFRHRHDSLLCSECEGRSLRLHHDQWSGMENSRPCRRFADHRRRLLHRPERRVGRRNRQRRGEHQGRGRAYHHREHAARNVPAGRRNGCDPTHRPELRRDKERLQYVDMVYYVLRKDGAYTGVSLWEGYGDETKPHRIAIHDGTKRLEKTTSLFRGMSQAWPPLFKS